MKLPKFKDFRDACKDQVKPPHQGLQASLKLRPTGRRQSMQLSKNAIMRFPYNLSNRVPSVSILRNMKEVSEGFLLVDVSEMVNFGCCLDVY